MPSHIHLFLGFDRIEKMSLVMQNFKLLSAHRLKLLIPPKLGNGLYVGEKFRMWQPRLDDVLIWSEVQFKTKLEYIHNNPVKAGLVKSATDYEYSSARDWLSQEDGLVSVDKDWSWLREN
jgi:REP element-mobilizing transposase RayT